MNQSNDTRLNAPPMALALDAAEHAAAHGDVPVGAVIIDRQQSAILAITGNRVEIDNDPCGHAEILALRAAAAILGTARLVNCDLYVTRSVSCCLWMMMLWTCEAAQLACGR